MTVAVLTHDWHQNMKRITMKHLDNHNMQKNGQVLRLLSFTVEAVYQLDGLVMKPGHFFYL